MIGNYSITGPFLGIVDRNISQRPPRRELRESITLSHIGTSRGGVVLGRHKGEATGPLSHGLVRAR